MPAKKQSRSSQKRHECTLPSSACAESTGSADPAAPRLAPLIAMVKRKLRAKLEEIENTASMTKRPAGGTRCDVLQDYTARFGVSVTQEEFDVLIFHFLRAHKEDIDSTVDALIATAEFRHRQNIDRMAVFSSLIPIRGYDEEEICRTLKLPCVKDSIEESSASTYLHSHDGSDRVLRTAINEFYSTPYSQILEPEPPTSAVAASRRDHRRFSATSADRHKGSSAHAGSATDSRQKPPQRSLASRFLSHINPFSRRSGASTSDGSHTDRADAHGSAVTRRHARPARGEDNDDDARDIDSDGRVRGEEDSLAASGRAAVDPEAALFMDTNTSAVYVPPPSGLDIPCLNFHGLLSPIVRLLLQHVPMSFHYWDREGRPVLYASVAPLRSRALLRDLTALCPMSTEPKAVVMLFQTYLMEVLTQLIRFRDFKNRRDNEIRDALLRQSSNMALTSHVLPRKGRVTTAVVIIDCAGLDVKHFMCRPLLHMARPIFTLVQRHYPETLHRLYVVNCQTAFSKVYKAVRGVLTEDTRRKIVFCDAEETPCMLKQVIDSDILPESLTGRCHCLGGCIPTSVPDLADASETTSGYSAGDGTSLSASVSVRLDRQVPLPSLRAEGNLPLQGVSKFVRVKPRRRFKWSLPITAGEEVIWEYREVHHKRLTFSVAFVAVADGQIYELSARGRTTEGANHYIAQSGGVLLLEWSNRRSKFTTRKIRIKLYRDGGTIGFNDDDEES